MKISSLTIKNFRAIKSLKIDEIRRSVVICGLNGCGKSSILEAIRLLSSVYGVYAREMWRLWLNEQGINSQYDDIIADKILRDRKEPMVISANIMLSDEEKDYVIKNYKKIAEKDAWSRVVGWGTQEKDDFIIDPHTRARSAVSVGEYLDALREDVLRNINEEYHTAKLTLSPAGEALIEESSVLDLIFSPVDYKVMGIVDYHGPNRSFVRENLSGVSVKVAEHRSPRSYNALYNTSSKYSGTKGELAQAFVESVISKEFGLAYDGLSVSAYISDLFTEFFPGKEFKGVVPRRDGSLTFPIVTSDGCEHDLEDLSSGEKELLMGYLKLKALSPRNSIILHDEPELHLNPKHVRSMPQFYHKHIGAALNNQLWLVTHSDSLLREAIYDGNYQVFHLQAADSSSEGNQISAVDGSDLNRIVLDLVGNIASFNPSSKIVVIEGEGDEFDRKFIETLFPYLSEKLTFISGGSKGRAREIHHALRSASIPLGEKFYSIVDQDFEGEQATVEENKFQWNVYHIENYLLHEDIIVRLANVAGLAGNKCSLEYIKELLIECAKETVDTLVEIKMRNFINSKLINAIKLNIGSSRSMSQDFRRVSVQSLARISSIVKDDLTLEKISEKEAEIRSEISNWILDGSWRNKMRGRDILKRLCGKFQKPIQYPIFRNLLVREMHLAGHVPPEMKSILDKIIAD